MHQLWNGIAQNYKDQIWWRKVDKKANLHENWNRQTLFIYLFIYFIIKIVHKVHTLYTHAHTIGPTHTHTHTHTHTTRPTAMSVSTHKINQPIKFSLCEHIHTIKTTPDKKQFQDKRHSLPHIIWDSSPRITPDNWLVCRSKTCQPNVIARTAILSVLESWIFLPNIIKIDPQEFWATPFQSWCIFETQYTVDKQFYWRTPVTTEDVRFKK